MKTGFKKLTVSLVFSVLSVGTSLAGLPEGSFKGKSSIVGGGFFNNDVMALFVQKDQEVEDRYYAVLAEYDRIPLTNFTVRTAITKWVPRMYAYQIEKVGELEYAMKPLHVTSTGEIEVNPNATADKLTLKYDETMNGAVIERASDVEETIRMKGRVGSTWEEYVPGYYYGTTKKTGGDYFRKTVNSELTTDGIAKFNTPDIEGEFTISEKIPGMFTFRSSGEVLKGEERVVKSIGVFIDIVNWKPLFTTDELLLINPENASDVGFFYERH